MKAVRSVLKAGLFATALMAVSQGAYATDIILTGNLYVADYGKSVMERYKWTYDQTTNVMTSITPNGINGSTTNAYFIGDATNFPIKEGVHGTLNDLILVGGFHGSGVTNISRYRLDGSLIGSIPVDFSAFNGGNVGIGNVVVTSDGKFMFAPLESGNAVVKIDLATGAIVASFAYNGAHDVALTADGQHIFVANYANATPKVIVLDSNLTAGSRVDLITAQPSGVSGPLRPSGLSVAADGSLYIDDNTNTSGGHDSILHYNITYTAGAPTAATYDATGSYVGSATNNALHFTFGNSIGPDGNLYIADLGGGGAGGFAVSNGHVDGVYKFDTTTHTVSLVIAGKTETAGAVGASSLSAPKYLQFDSNFVTAPDADYAPEPATLAVFSLGLGALGIARRRKRA